MVNDYTKSCGTVLFLSCFLSVKTNLPEAIPMPFPMDLIVVTGQFTLPIMFQIKLIRTLLGIVKLTQKTDVLSLILMEPIIQEKVTTNPKKDVKIKHFN